MSIALLETSGAPLRPGTPDSECKTAGTQVEGEAKRPKGKARFRMADECRACPPFLHTSPGIAAADQESRVGVLGHRTPCVRRNKNQENLYPAMNRQIATQRWRQSWRLRAEEMQFSPRSQRLGRELISGRARRRSLSNVARNRHSRFAGLFPSGLIPVIIHIDATSSVGLAWSCVA